MIRAVDEAETEIGVTLGERLSAERIGPLEECSSSLAKLDPPPSLLEQALTDTSTACGEGEYALALYARLGSPALASTDKHPQNSWRLLQAASLNIERQLEGDTS